MAHPARDDAKYLEDQHADLVSKTRHPGLRDVEGDDLSALERDLRGLRDQARSDVVASRGGDGDAEAGRGSRRRSQILTQAVKRVARERGRRDRGLARADLRQFAADVMGTSMDKKGAKRGTAKGFSNASRKAKTGK